MWILNAGVSKTQEDTLQVFIIKIEMCKDNWGKRFRTQHITTATITILAGKTQNITATLRLLRSQNKELQFYYGKVHILTDLSANSTCPSL